MELRGSIPPPPAIHMILDLQPPLSNLWRKGYLRIDSDGRRKVDLYNSNADRTTISYARYLMCVEVGYMLPASVEVDHKDNDCTNDDISNLQILTKEAHREKTISLLRPRAVKVCVCPVCHTEFVRFANKIVPGTSPVCSRRCNGIRSREIQLGRYQSGISTT